MKTKITLALMAAAIAWLAFDNWKQARRIGSLEDDLLNLDVSRLAYAVTESELEETGEKIQSSVEDLEFEVEEIKRFLRR